MCLDPNALETVSSKTILFDLLANHLLITRIVSTDHQQQWIR